MTRSRSILAPNFTVELVKDGRSVPVNVDLLFYNGNLEGKYVYIYIYIYIA